MIFAALTACWPAAETRRLGPWTLRRGEGGKRTRSATLDGPLGDPAEAEAAMRAMGQRPLFMIRRGESDLDALLNERGYGILDSVAILAAPVAALAGDAPDWAPDWATVRCALPLAAMVEIWAAGGIGPGRLAVMQRVALPKRWLLVRDGDRPAGCGFVDVSGEMAMLHAVAIAPGSRRHGLGARLVRAAGRWAGEQGATTLALAVSRANAPALALYDRLGLAEIAGYHYRAAPPGSGPI